MSGLSFGRKMAFIMILIRPLYPQLFLESIVSMTNIDFEAPFFVEKSWNTVRSHKISVFM